MMKNVTLAIDEELLARARSLAARRGLTLNAMVREHLKSLVEDEARIAEAKRGLRRLMERSVLEFDPGTNLKQLSRDSDPDIVPGHQHPDRSREDQVG